MAKGFTVSWIAEHTGIDRRTIPKILRDVKPFDSNDNSDLYLLADFIEALRAHDKGKSGRGDLEAEKTRLTAVQADIAEVERAKRRNEVIEAEAVVKVWENIAVAIRRTILTSGLSNPEKDHILSELKSMSIDAILEQQEFDEETGESVSKPVRTPGETNGKPVVGAP
jgi:phage terminase Nu1 subunit (DNA packaging protein)